MPAASPPGRKTLFWLYKTMLKIRRFEELHLLFLQGELPVIFLREQPV